jgi:hypothetical protein
MLLRTSEHGSLSHMDPQSIAILIPLKARSGDDQFNVVVLQVYFSIRPISAQVLCLWMGLIQVGTCCHT